MKFTDELTLLLKARYPIIYINTIEEDRVEYIIRKYIKTSLNRSIYSWDFIDGYTNNPNNEGFAKRNPVQALELVERIDRHGRTLFALATHNGGTPLLGASGRRVRGGHEVHLEPIWRPLRRLREDFEGRRRSPCFDAGIDL